MEIRSYAALGEAEHSENGSDDEEDTDTDKDEAVVANSSFATNKAQDLLISGENEDGH